MISKTDRSEVIAQIRKVVYNTDVESIGKTLSTLILINDMLKSDPDLIYHLKTDINYLYKKLAETRAKEAWRHLYE